MQALYKLSRVSPLEYIFTASSFSDALNRITIFQRILGDDVRHIRATQERKAELDAKRAALVQKHDGNRSVAGAARKPTIAARESLKSERSSLLASAEQRAANASWQNASLQEEINRREAENLAIQAKSKRRRSACDQGYSSFPKRRRTVGAARQAGTSAPPMA